MDRNLVFIKILVLYFFTLNIHWIPPVSQIEEKTLEDKRVDLVSSGVRGASRRRRRQYSSFLRWFFFGFSVVSSSSPSCQGSGSGDSPGEIFAREEFRSGVGFTSSGVKARRRVVAVGEALLLGFSSGRFPLSSASREGCAWRWTLGSCYGSWWFFPDLPFGSLCRAVATSGLVVHPGVSVAL
ncbi:hypothetical protein Bca4012_007902 [Brassica carinata]